MESILQVDNLCKEYPAFSLKNVNFSIKKGSIMGFIGRNGAGKTTTLKAIMNLVHPTSGQIYLFSFPLIDNEKEIKQKIGYATGGISYYQRKKLKDIINITKIFYKNWDNKTCLHYLKAFSLDQDKKLFELSEGMKVKFNLTLALSHHAELLILDEPTSGLDPVSREELLEIFIHLAKKGVSILFSTHIISDLSKCADYITYIRQGEIIASEKLTTFLNNYSLVVVKKNSDLSQSQIDLSLGTCQEKNNVTYLIKRSDEKNFENFLIHKPDLESIMVHLEKKEISL